MNKGLFSITAAGEALAATVSETILSIVSGVAADSRSFEVVRWGISFSGVDPEQTPVAVDLFRPGSDGTSSLFGGDGKLKSLNPASDAVQARGRTAFTAEPTIGDVLETYQISPYGGLFVMQYAPDERPVCNGGGVRIGIRCLSTSVVTVAAFMVIAE